MILSGGSALGAYQAGAFQALSEAGWAPDWVAGASAGAINGALICGNAPEQRIKRLAELWQPGSAFSSHVLPDAIEEARRTSAAVSAMTIGKAGIFVPRSLYGPWWNPFANAEPSSLYDTTPLRATLEQLVDFDRLNNGSPRFSATATDVTSGEDVVFDTTHHRLQPDYIRASAALMPVFPPVEVGDRLLGDAGISINLPLDVVLSEAGKEPIVCVAIDLLPFAGPRPQSLGEVAVRTQDLIFATQSRRALASWQALFDNRLGTPEQNAVTLLHIAYSDHAREVSGKAFDFSPETIRQRWDAGHRDMAEVLEAVDQGNIALDQPGLNVFAKVKDGSEAGFAAKRYQLRPQLA